MITVVRSGFLRRWAAIASYLPQRTDNNIKSYWNTHLKKKLNGRTHIRSIHLGNSGADGISNALAVLPLLAGDDREICDDQLRIEGELRQHLLVVPDNLAGGRRWRRSPVIILISSSLSFKMALNLSRIGVGGYWAMTTLLDI
ncbi:hypothetical protein RJ639_035549 [Escallonia herrerae]|uniref:Uncharacterized protein n=1 Tax=Escallonia herrerae TaxID=1293975 RepID=A0AA88WR91_9ASTE|nr:hypothetical protein RJ639_035549 [Escallonia herrerae]